MFTFRRLVLVLIICMMMIGVSIPTAQAQAGNGCAAFPAPGIGPADTVVTNVRLVLRPLPSITEGRPYGVLPAGTELTILYGPSCTDDYQRWYVGTQDGQYGWVAIGKWYPNWVTLKEGSAHVNTCVAQLDSVYLGYSAQGPTMSAVFLVPRNYGAGSPLVGQPGVVKAEALGDDGVYLYWQITILNPEDWGYDPGPLGLPMLYYYC